VHEAVMFDFTRVYSYNGGGDYEESITGNWVVPIPIPETYRLYTILFNPNGVGFTVDLSKLQAQILINEVL
jgi:hypothetical protein